MSQNAPQPMEEPAGFGSTSCANCHSTMPTGLRFCRNCGYRLGEGVAEYTETARFPPGAMPHGFGMSGGQMATVAAGPLKRKKSGMSGMTWIFIAMIAFFLTAGMVTKLVRPLRRGSPFTGGPPAPPAAPRSYFGVNSFDTTDGGVTFDSIEAPGSPADKAGLVGGDIITSFDGQAVTTDDEIMELLGKTPVGKTVDIAFIRDGAPQVTKLTTISKGELDQLDRLFAARPEGRGRLGIDDQEEVDIPNLKIKGVRLGTVQASLPGDMAGLKTGDIVIKMGGVPIRTEAELNHRIQRAFPYETIEIEIVRGAETLKIPVRMGRR